MGERREEKARERQSRSTGYFPQCSGNEVTHALMDSAGARSGSSYQGGGGGGGGGGGWSGGYKSGKRRRTSGATVKARGLPYSTPEYDLVDFFADYGVSSGELLTATKVHTHV